MYVCTDARTNSHSPRCVVCLSVCLAGILSILHRETERVCMTLRFDWAVVFLASLSVSLSLSCTGKRAHTAPPRQGKARKGRKGRRPWFFANATSLPPHARMLPSLGIPNLSPPFHGHQGGEIVYTRTGQTKPPQHHALPFIATTMVSFNWTPGGGVVVVVGGGRTGRLLFSLVSPE